MEGHALILEELLGALRRTIEGARSMPMSSSAVINRADVLQRVSEIESALPLALSKADQVFGERDQVLADAQQQAAQIVKDAEAERDRLVSDTEVFRVAKRQADEVLAKARQESDELRNETNDYVDSRFANFEIALTKTLEAVIRGRERLQGRTELDALGLDDEADRPI
jgi:cell division septum initiation protein DivIVA